MSRAVPITETMMDPTHPSRFEKKANMETPAADSGRARYPTILQGKPDATALAPKRAAMRIATALVIAIAFAGPAAAQPPAERPEPTDVEYLRALTEYRQAVDESERASRRVNYIVLAAIAVTAILFWWVLRSESAARRRRDAQLAELERRNEQFMERSEAQAGRMIELLESIERALRDRDRA
jgi:hypothetical protein